MTATASVARGGDAAATAERAERASWDNPSNVSGPVAAEFGEIRRRDTRRERYEVREVVWRESNDRRLRSCGRLPISTEGVNVQLGDGIAGYGNLRRCGSIHACPVCAATIRNERAGDIEQGCQSWLERGGTVLFVTLTTRHDAGHALTDLWDVVADGFRAVISGRRWVADRESYGVVGTIRSVEVTHGDNGWHPHLHVLFFLDGQPGDRKLEELAGRIWQRWHGYIQRQGMPTPTLAHGIDVQRVGEAEVGGYLAKLQDGWGPGAELARADLKGGRTPFGILRDFAATGDADDLALWHIWERESKGRQAITWSRGLRELLLVADERDDQEIVDEEHGGEVVWRFSAVEWEAVMRKRGEAARILDAAEINGTAGIRYRVLKLLTDGFALPMVSLGCQGCTWDGDVRATMCGKCSHEQRERGRHLWAA